MSVAAERRRVLFVAEAVTLAHVSRAMTLARLLDPARYDVHLTWDPRYNGLLGPLGFPYRPLASMPTPTFLRRLAAGVPMHDTETLRGYVGEDLATIRDVRPDLIVSDFRFSLVASARLARVPLVTVANAYWSPFGRQTFMFPEYDYPLSRVVGDRVARRLFARFRNVGFAAHTRPLNTVLRERGLPGIGGDIRHMYTAGDYTAYADIPELMPTFDLPPTHRYIGPVLWSPAVGLPGWWADLPGDRPVIYATPGSSGDADMLRVVLDALSDLSVTVIGATAGRAALMPLPSNAFVADFLPGIEAARRSALVICNGGSPTTYQALSGGVPVLALASNNMDQHLNMEAVVGAGAGLVLRSRGVTGEAIRSSVERMLTEERFRLRAGELAEHSRSCDEQLRFSSLIEEVVTASAQAAST